MSVNLFGAETGRTLQQLGSDTKRMADGIDSLRVSLSAAPASRPQLAPVRVNISSTGSGQGIVWQTSDMLRLVGLIIGGANPGRYVLQIGRGDVSQAFWILANNSQQFVFSGDDRWEIARGLEITVVAPSAGAWDCTLSFYPVDMGQRYE